MDVFRGWEQSSRGVGLVVMFFNRTLSTISEPIFTVDCGTLIEIENEPCSLAFGVCAHKPNATGMKPNPTHRSVLMVSLHL